MVKSTYCRGPEFVIYLPPLGDNQGQEPQAVHSGSLLDSPGQQLKRGFLMSRTGLFVRWSSALGGSIIIPDKEVYNYNELYILKFFR